MNGLEAPLLRHEFGGQPIEQLRVGGQGPLRAKIIFGFDNAASEIFLPDSIDHDARGERIFGSSDPMREVQPIGPGLAGGNLKRRHNGWNTGGNFAAIPSEIAFDEEIAASNFFLLCHDKSRE